MPRIPDLRTAMPELDSDLGGHPDDVEWWLARHGRFDHMLAYSWLIWPPFTAHEGCVFLGSEVPVTYPEWKALNGDDRSAIEGILNHHHLEDLFPATLEPSYELLAYVGQLLKETWAAKLAHDFPDREFIVEFPEQFDIDTDNPYITFYSKPRA